MPKKILISSLRNDRGFTLMEVMIAIAIFAVGFLAVAAMQLSVVNSNKTGNTYTQALALAHAKMEELKNESINDTSGPLRSGFTNGIATGADEKLDENGNTGTGGIYTRSWTISEEYKDVSSGASTVQEARLVTVTVKFPFAMRGEREVSVTSVITGGGL